MKWEILCTDAKTILTVTKIKIMHNNFNFDDLGYWYFCRVLVKLYEGFHLMDQYEGKGTCTTISGYDTYTTYVDTEHKNSDKFQLKKLFLFSSL